MLSFTYHQFHKTLPRSSAFVKLFSVRFYETDKIDLCDSMVRNHNLDMESARLIQLQEYSQKSTELFKKAGR